WRVHRRFHLGLLRFRRRRRPAQLGRDPACARDRKSGTALIFGGPLRYWSVENLSRPSQPFSSAKKPEARRIFARSLYRINESVERHFLAGRYRQPARTKRKCATVPRHRGRGRSRWGGLGRGIRRGGKSARGCFLPSEEGGRYRSHH